jgi:hypothetical protein
LIKPGGVKYLMDKNKITVLEGLGSCGCYPCSNCKADGTMKQLKKNILLQRDRSLLICPLSKLIKKE